MTTDTTPAPTDKQQIREQAHAARRALEDKDERSARIMDRVLALPEYERAQTVMFYIDVRAEVRTRASLPDALALPLHLTPRQCGALAAIALPKRLVLTHFYPPVEAEDIESQVAEQFGGTVIRCHDGWSLDLEEEGS
jgi:phosphoribosyl 1,2-cyclic phosphodiesterase